MKFDICLMNPPYDKGLHLKFLEKAIKISDNVVSVQPISAFQQEAAFDDKKLNNIKVTDIDAIPIEYANKLFPGIQIRQDLGIILIDKNSSNNFDNITLYENKDIIKKCIEYVKSNDCLLNHLKTKISGISLKINKGGAFYGNGKITKSTFRLSAIDYKLAISNEEVGHIVYLVNIPSDSIRKNIWEFYNSVFMRYWIYKCNFALQRYDLVPFIGFNRYKKSWTVDDYKNFFVNEIGLTEEEWNTYKTEAEKLPV